MEQTSIHKSSEPDHTLSNRTASIAHKLGDRDPTVQAEGEQEIQRLGPEGLEVLLSIARDEERKGSRRFRMSTVALLLWGILLGVMALLFGRPFKSTGIAMLYLAMMLLPFVAYVACLRPSRLLRKTVLLLTTYRDVRTVGVLIDNLALGKEVEQALTRLLPRLRESDAALINETRRDKLYDLLKEVTEGGLWQRKQVAAREPLYLAVLKALEQIGDADAVPILMRLTVNTQWRHLQVAAHSSLPYLLARIEMQVPQKELLRPD